MKWFKRKPKIVLHELKYVGFAPRQSHFHRAVECRHCGKQFIMDVFGGWAIEWKYRELLKHESLKHEDVEEAVDAMSRIPVSGWTQLGYNDICIKESETK